MLQDVVQRKKFYTLVLQKCLTRSNVTLKKISAKFENNYAINNLANELEI